MILSDLSIRRPVAMSCVLIALTLLGLNAYRKMGLELMPKVDLPFITILTVYPGATPEELETDVAKRIEDAVVAVEGLKHITSNCMENMCQSFLEFQIGVDIDIASIDVREKLDLIRADFPEGVEDLVVQKFNINAKPIVTLALTGDVPLDALYDFANNKLRDRITVIPGVAGVRLVGGAPREVHVELDRDRLAARGLTSMSVVGSVRQALATVPAGRVREQTTEYAVTFDGQSPDLEALGDLEVANEGGQRCHIRDVGRVLMTTSELRQTARIDGRPGVAISVIKKSDANAVQVAHAVRDAMTRLNTELPGGMALVWVNDDGRFVEATNNSAWLNVAEGILLTAAILLLFLYNFRTLLIVAVTMPLTIIIGLFLMQLIGYTLNVSTLIAIGMSVGILVTDSIVVVEAIANCLQHGADPKTAARRGAQDAFLPAMTSAATNVVVLFPLAMMQSRVGLFIGPLAMTMFLMTVVSLFVSFTVIPLLCGLVLVPRATGQRSLLARMERVWNHRFDQLVAGYRRMLEFSQRRRWAAVLVLLGIVAIFVQSLVAAGTLGTSPFPETDMGQIYVRLEFPSRYNLAETVRRVDEVEARISGLPELRHVLSTVGKIEAVLGQASEGAHLAQVLLKFSERDERTLSIGQLKEMVRARLKDFPDARVAVSQPSIMGGEGTPVLMVITGDQFETLDALALRTCAAIRAMPGIEDADTSVRPGKPEIRVRPLRSVLGDLQSPAAGLGLALRANLEGIKAGTYKENARNYDIVVKLAEEAGRDQVGQFRFPGVDGHSAILANLGEVVEGEVPVHVLRFDKQRMTSLTAGLDQTLPLGKAVAQIGDVVQHQVGMPPGYDYTFIGFYEFMAEGQVELVEVGVVAMILVVLTLAGILESFRQPIIILITVPLALVGTVWALQLSGGSFGIFVVMGIVMMTGIVVNNAILIVDRFNILVTEGMPRHEAMITAACQRFRPVVMITVAAVLGMLPLAFGHGIGAELRSGVGIASIGGILVSGVLTLVALPILYGLFTRRTAKTS
jgi:HAE1 family hydrophobic/amphiphilic exporter-1